MEGAQILPVWNVPSLSTVEKLLENPMKFTIPVLDDPQAQLHQFCAYLNALFLKSTSCDLEYKEEEYPKAIATSAQAIANWETDTGVPVSALPRSVAQETRGVNPILYAII
jgi:hypothetical protein